MKLFKYLNIKLFNYQIYLFNHNNQRKIKLILYYVLIIYTCQLLLLSLGIIKFTNAKCYPIRGISPNIIIDCDRDSVATFHYFNSQDRYSYETIEDDGHHFFYPHLFKSRLYDQSFNGGPIIVFEPEVKFIYDYIPMNGGDMFIRGNFLFDFEKNIKPLEVYYGDMSTFSMLNDTIVTPKYYGKDIYSIYIQPGCNAFIKVIDPKSNKILTETNYIYDENKKCVNQLNSRYKSYNQNQNHINNHHLNNNS